MLEALKKQFSVQWKDWMMMSLLLPGVWALGAGLHYVLIRMDSEVTSYFPMGTLMAALTAGVCAAIMGILQLGFYFNMEISLGFTRAGFFLSYYAVSFVFSAFYTGILILLNLIERILEKYLYPDLSCEIDFLPYLLKGGIPAAAAVCLVSGFCGVLILRFGKKASWGIWALWMICCVGGPQIFNAAEAAPDSLFGWIGNKIGWMFSGFTVKEVIAAVAVLSVLSLAGAWGYLRKQQVTS
ncbi:MAG: hypothetical protein Q4C91_07065 [Eubacteriales bacterium]|nr:hypothetical protein [Eubacteriales bacterium]